MPLPPVIFEDEDLIAFDKPSGLAIAPLVRDRTRESLTELVRAKFGAGVALVHRIDDETSGLVLYAKNKPALDFVSGQFQSKTVIKRYHALVIGVPATDEFLVDLVLKEDEAKPGTMCVVKKHGLASETEVQVLEKFPAAASRPAFTLIEARPRTGRMHQVRIHLAATGTPILNDPLYADQTALRLSDLKRGYKGRTDEKPLIGRLALHAAALTFLHPTTRATVTLTAEAAKDLGVALKYLQKFAGPRVR